MLPCRFVQITAAVLLAGTAVLRLLALGTDVSGFRAWNRLAWGSWGALALASVWQLGLTAAAMSGLPLAQAVSSETLGQVLAGTSYGAAWQARACLLAGTLAFLWFRPPTGHRKRTAATFDVTGVLLAAALLASLVWTGHARASASHAWLLPVNLMHVGAAGAWPGGLVPLAFLLARAGRDPGLVPSALTVTRRFSRLSVAAVMTLALSGLLNGYGLIGASSMIWTSFYGRLGLCKAALLVGMVGLGAVNRRLVRQEGPDEKVPVIRWLWRNVAWECALAALVLLASEALAMSAPPRGLL